MSHSQIHDITLPAVRF